MKEILIGIAQLVVGVALIFRLFQRGPITYRYSKAPVPNQKFLGFLFRVAGVALVLGGIWWLWSIWRLNHLL